MATHEVARIGFRFQPSTDALLNASQLPSWPGPGAQECAGSPKLRSGGTGVLGSPKQPVIHRIPFCAAYVLSLFSFQKHVFRFLVGLAVGFPLESPNEYFLAGDQVGQQARILLGRFDFWLAILPQSVIRKAGNSQGPMHPR